MFHVKQLEKYGKGVDMNNSGNIKRNKKAKSSMLLALLMIVVMVFAVGCGDSTEGEEQQAEQTNYVKWKEVGKWQKTKKKAKADKKKHTVKFRIAKVISNEKKALKAINDFNNSGQGNMIETELDNDQLQYCVADYEVKYPSDFPDEQFGLMDVAMKFKITALDGSSDLKVGSTVYKNLSKTQEIGDLPVGWDFYSGQTYKGKIAYVIPKGFTDYCIKGGGKYFKAPDKK